MFPQKVPSVSGNVMARSLSVSGLVIWIDHVFSLKIVEILKGHIFWSWNWIPIIKTYGRDVAVVFKVGLRFNAFLVKVFLTQAQIGRINITLLDIHKIR
jgi:hypothetical protein